MMNNYRIKYDLIHETETLCAYYFTWKRMMKSVLHDIISSNRNIEFNCIILISNIVNKLCFQYREWSILPIVCFSVVYKSWYKQWVLWSKRKRIWRRFNWILRWLKTFSDDLPTNKDVANSTASKCKEIHSYFYRKLEKRFTWK